MESLMERTRRLLRESEVTLPDIYAGLRNKNPETKITYFWLRKFSSGDIPDPSVNRVEELYQFLTGFSVLTSKK